MKKVDFSKLQTLDLSGDNSLAGMTGIVIVSILVDAAPQIIPDLETSTGNPFDLVTVNVAYKNDEGVVENLSASVSERANNSAQEQAAKAIAAGEPSYSMPMAVSTSKKNGNTYFSVLSYENGMRKLAAMAKAKAKQQAKAQTVEQGAPTPETT